MQSYKVKAHNNQQNNYLEAHAIAKNVKGSSQKAKLVIDIIRGRNVADAFSILSFTNKRSVRPIEKVLRSAVANVLHKADKNNVSVNPEKLIVSNCYVDVGKTKKHYRVRPASMGRAYRERRHYCNITVCVSSHKTESKLENKRSDMATLTFGIKPTHNNELSKWNLPVEVYKPNLVMVARTFTSEKLSIAPGTYYFVSKLPAGQELKQYAKIYPNVENRVLLELDEEKECSEERQSSQHFLVAQQLQLTESKIRRVDGSFPFLKTFPFKLKTFVGNPLMENIIDNQDSNWKIVSKRLELVEVEVEVEVYKATQTQIVQLLQGNGEIINQVLPTGPEHGCNLIVTQTNKDQYTIDPHLHNSTANLLLYYFHKGYQQQTKEMVKKVLEAEKLLRSKIENPIAATVGAYALLQFNELEQLHNWTKNLCDWFEWLPDGAVILGEHLARTGKHDEALEVFIKIFNRGLPIFSDGLSYTINRLRLYLTLGKNSFDSVKLEQAKSLLVRLEQFALYTDFNKPLTTYFGAKPDKPGSKTIY